MDPIGAHIMRTSEGGLMSTLIHDIEDTGDASGGGPRVGARPNGTTWRFVRHYLEMVAAMLAGMIALAAASGLGLDLPDRTAVELIEMAVWMTVPMVAWMRIRGHGWRSCH